MSLQESARNGDIKALEALMNKSFAAQNVTVRVTHSGKKLKVRVSGTEPPTKVLAAKIKKGINTISPKGFTEFFVQAETVGRGLAWKDSWTIDQEQQTVATQTPIQVKSEGASNSKNLTGQAKTATLPKSSFPLAAVIGIAIASTIGLGVLATGAVVVMSNSRSSEEIVEPPVDYWQQALDTGQSAAVDAGEAITDRDWRQVFDQWGRAISSLEQIPEDSPQYADAQTKITEYTANREVAQAKYQELREQKAAREQAAEDRAAARKNRAVEVFMTQVREIDPSGSLITSAKLSPFDEEGKTVIITVATAWHSQPKATREDAATGIYTIWAASYLSSGGNSDETPYMRLENASGTEVGGYGPLKGVYIKD